MWYICTMEHYSAIQGILFSHTKEQNNAICSNMNATRYSHTKWSQKEKDKYHMISHMWNLIYGINEPIYRKETHGLGEQTCGYQRGRGGNGMD